MPEELSPGMRIFVDPFGKATLIRATGSGALVELDGSKLRVHAPREQMRPIGTGPVARSTPAAGPSLADPSTTLAPAPVIETTPVSREQLRALRSIEALRFGVVPSVSLRDVTVRFAELETWVNARLSRAANSGPEIAEVCGPFGTGKSHTMAAVRQIAQESGWVTAWVDVDGTMVSLSDPAQLLAQLWPTVSARDFESSLPILELYRRAIQHSPQGRPKALKSLEPVCSNYETVATVKKYLDLGDFEAAFEGLLAYCEPVGPLGRDLSRAISSRGLGYSVGASIKPRRMISFRVQERAEDFVRCILGHAVVASLAGFRGLVVTIDEFEVEHSYPTHFGRVEAVLTAIAELLAGDSGLPAVPLALVIATVGQEGDIGDRYVEKLLESTRGNRFQVAALTKDDRFWLADKIHALYNTAYVLDGPFSAEVVARVEKAIAQTDVYESALVRAFVKRYVAELDSQYGPRAA